MGSRSQGLTLNPPTEGAETTCGNTWFGAAGGEVSTGLPAVFPVTLRATTLPADEPGDLVLDPFSGSGFVPGSEDAGAPVHWAGGEPEYCRIAEQRIAQEVLALA